MTDWISVKDRLPGVEERVLLRTAVFYGGGKNDRIASIR